MSSPTGTPTADRAVPSPSEVAAVHRRTLGTLWVAAVLGRGGFSAMFPVSVLAIADLLGSPTFAGLSTGSITIGSAASAGALAALMQRRGRSVGLGLGYAVAAAGAVAAIVAIQQRILPLFIVGMVMIGVGSGAANLARYAAADLAPEHRRSRDISSVIFASTFGAVLFPLFIGWAGDVAEARGIDGNAGGFGLAILLFGGAWLATTIFMRPDPLKVAQALEAADAGRADHDLGSAVDPDTAVDGSGTDEAQAARPGVAGVTVRPTARRASEPRGFTASIRVAWSHPLARLAVVSLVVSQAVMVMVMAMTPLHMEEHGHDTGTVGAVIAAHTAGMFAFAPLAGWLSDRLGRVPTIGIGSVTLILATAMTALAGEAPALLMFPGLYLLGLGWSFGIVAGSALLTESVPADDRVEVQGAADLAMNLASGLGALSSGVVLGMAGFHILSMLGMVGAGVLLARTVMDLRFSRAGLV